jgi:hypothetical protein
MFLLVAGYLSLPHHASTRACVPAPLHTLPGGAFGVYVAGFVYQPGGGPGLGGAPIVSLLCQRVLPPPGSATPHPPGPAGRWSGHVIVVLVLGTVVFGKRT